ncbi:MAG: TonB-dependent receptor [Bacteroidales bacterium]|nr:TonB-dependent receptor [Bacteroidales bacterium]
MKIKLTFLFLFMSSLMALAQPRVISGTVIGTDGEPVAGLMVLERGTTNGSYTDAEGHYSISVASDAVLEFCGLGYKTLVAQPGAQTTLNVTVEIDALMLDAVVAIGYGTALKKDITTAISTVGTEDVKLRPITDPSGFIQGKVAGVTVQQTSGQPGQGMTIRIRGLSSIASSNDPLYVVDGVPVGTGYTAIAFLSPNDIETMQILKDASSAAIYGSRAANGVVLITTKQGKVSMGPQVSFSSYASLSRIVKKFDVLNVEQYRELLQEVDPAFTLPDGLKDQTNWYDATLRNALSRNYQLSVSNATDNLRYYLALGYSNEEGIFKSAYNTRYNAKVNVESDLYDWLTVGTNMAYSSYRNNGIITGQGSYRAGVLPSIINCPTYAKVWDETHPDQYWTTFYGANVGTPTECVARSMNNYNQTDRLLLTGFAVINFNRNLRFKSSVSMDRSWKHNYYYLDPIHTTYGRTQHGLAEDSRSDDRRMVYDNILTYNNSLSGKHNIELMGGSSITTSDYQSLWGSRYYFSTEYADAIKGLNGGNYGGLRGQSQSWSQWAIISYLARASYNYDSRYYLTLNFRADGSSKLAPHHKWGVFPSASAAWRLTEEEWMKDIKWIDEFKLRLGWGQQGNQSGLSDYAWVQYYDINYYDWTTPANADAVPTLGAKTNIGNKELTWETTTQTNIGADLAILDGKVEITADAFYKYTKNLLMSVPMPAPNPAITRNEGEMSNYGFEFAVSSTPVRTKDFSWQTDFNISSYRNKLEKLSLRKIYYMTSIETVGDYVIRMEEGHPLSSFWGYVSEGVDPETGMLLYKDVNEDGKVNSSDKTFIGCANPDFTFGWNNTLSYKGFNLNFLITGSVGNEIFNASRLEMIGMYNAQNQITDVLRRWRTPGQVTDIPRAGSLDNLKASTYWVEDGSYLKVKNITLSYNFSGEKLRKYRITTLQPYLTFDNYITLTKFKGYDPEMSEYTDATSMGVDWGTYPCVKSIVLGINVVF